MSMRTRRKLTSQFKFRVVLETLQEKEKQIEIARQYGIHPQLIIQWKRELLRRGHEIFEKRREKQQKDRKLEELEKLIGRQAIEIQFLKKILGHLG